MTGHSPAVIARWKCNVRGITHNLQRHFHLETTFSHDDKRCATHRVLLALVGAKDAMNDVSAKEYLRLVERGLCPRTLTVRFFDVCIENVDIDAPCLNIRSHGRELPAIRLVAEQPYAPPPSPATSADSPEPRATEPKGFAAHQVSVSVPWPPGIPDPDVTIQLVDVDLSRGAMAAGVLVDRLDRAVAEAVQHGAARRRPRTIQSFHESQQRETDAIDDTIDAILDQGGAALLVETLDDVAISYNNVVAASAASGYSPSFTLNLAGLARRAITLSRYSPTRTSLATPKWWAEAAQFKLGLEVIPRGQPATRVASAEIDTSSLVESWFTNVFSALPRLHRPAPLSSPSGEPVLKDDELDAYQVALENQQVQADFVSLVMMAGARETARLRCKAELTLGGDLFEKRSRPPPPLPPLLFTKADEDDALVARLEEERYQPRARPSSTEFSTAPHEMVTPQVQFQLVKALELAAETAARCFEEATHPMLHRIEQLRVRIMRLEFAVAEHLEKQTLASTRPSTTDSTDGNSKGTAATPNRTRPPLSKAPRGKTNLTAAGPTL
jgi:hypothetical protein